MVWGQMIPLFLLIVLHGECGGYEHQCREETCQCGENVTVTCHLTEPLKEITLEYDRKRFPAIYVTAKEGRREINNTYIEWTEDKVKVTISNVTFSDTRKYLISGVGKKSQLRETIAINVIGTCQPKISEKNTTEELECEVKSDRNAFIVWEINNNKILNLTTRVEQLDKGFILSSTLNLTEEIKNERVCCSVRYKETGTSRGNPSCRPSKNVSRTDTAKGDKQLSSKNPAISAFLILLAAAVVAVAFWYLLKRRGRTIVGEEPEEQKTTESPLLLPEAV